MAIKYIVRHGVMRFLGQFEPDPAERLYERGQHVIVQTERGREPGEVLCPATPVTLNVALAPAVRLAMVSLTPLFEAASVKAGPLVCDQ